MRNVMVVLALVLATVYAQAENEKAAPKKRLVDMSDGMNQADFYKTKDPDSIWSSDGAQPWKKDDAVKAYEQTEASKPAAGKTAPAAVKEESLQAGVDRPAVQPLMENGKAIESGRLINIRVRYTLDAEHSKASFSPVSAQNEMYRQMSSHCGNGFQKMSEWSTPIEGADYYLYYQFRCMDVEAK